MKKIKVAIVGAAGRMGLETVKAITATPDLELVAAIGRDSSPSIGQDIGSLAGIQALNLKLTGNLVNTLHETSPHVMIDFTVPHVVLNNALTALACGCRPILGATGLSAEDLEELDAKAKLASLSVLVAPNFAIGAILMIEAAKLAAPFFDSWEIIEYHHDKKIDSPSGTSIKTAHELNKLKPLKGKADPAAARGDSTYGCRIHSIRLPGLLAHQEVIFGAGGQTLSIRHDTLDRSSFMPGVVLAARRINEFQGLVYGLERMLSI